MSDLNLTQLRLRELKTGLTWDTLADLIGASSGDYVRKVASGAKPGRNLTENVDRLYTTGRVDRAVPRRRAASGKLARVRAPSRAGAPSRRPSENITLGRVAQRDLFRTPDGRLGWIVNVGNEPEQFDRAVREAQRRGKRVSFRVAYRTVNGDKRWATIGSRGGYGPGGILQDTGGMDAEELTDWIISEGNIESRYSVDLSHAVGIQVVVQ